MSYVVLKLQRHLSGSICPVAKLALVRTDDGQPSAEVNKPNESTTRQVMSVESESEFQVKSRDPEADAWAVIDALPVEDILNSLPPRTIRNIPSGL